MSAVVISKATSLVTYRGEMELNKEIRMLWKQVHSVGL